ncbi:MAG: UDP-N-acetylglucosamine 2-epimerase (non-hydrolyzing) [Gammaproteobacteria bacterium]|nr:UDP-N-acetylglucosamine 2-epimerase (non-hydrolyzing) [Gammaproteobacteria bacterium]
MRILLVIGTRPEAIKMAMVARALNRTDGIEPRICATAQHRELLDSVLDLFELRSRYDLNVMTPDQDLVHVSKSVLTGMPPILEEFRPDRVLVQGDTTTTLAAALAAFYANVPVGHVEAGLRSGDPTVPWPEEMNRRLADRLSDRHYAPTPLARENLLAEGFDDSSIVVTGNTGIDALLHIVERLDAEPKLRERARSELPDFEETRRLVLVTAHRRENIGSGLAGICDALVRLSKRTDVEIVYPVHPNPHVHGPVHLALGGEPHVHILPPLDYVSFAYLMSQAHFIVTDSGGIQEEAPAFGVPVLVTRDITERPEALDAGTARLVGTDSDTILREAEFLLEDSGAHEVMSRRHNPYGDGRASGRIVSDLL